MDYSVVYCNHIELAGVVIRGRISTKKFYQTLYALQLFNYENL